MPRGFKDLKVAELKAAARGFAAEDEDKIDSLGKDALIAALVESGVQFEDYKAMFEPEEEEEVLTTPVEETVVVEADEVKVEAPAVVTTSSIGGSVSREDFEAVLAQMEELKATLAAGGTNIGEVSDDLVLDDTQEYLVKMVRENPLFEENIGGHTYRFTTAHPYVLMPARHAEQMLGIDGFRQAKPSEVSEYYS